MTALGGQRMFRCHSETAASGDAGRMFTTDQRPLVGGEQGRFQPNVFGV
jgi:hypothetical protein